VILILQSRTITSLTRVSSLILSGTIAVSAIPTQKQKLQKSNPVFHHDFKKNKMTVLAE
jgi:hypothetical protein